jgi:hypothetical protein
MNEEQEWDGDNYIPGPFGAKFAPIEGERQVGETGANPSNPGCGKNPPQAVENR